MPTPIRRSIRKPAGWLALCTGAILCAQPGASSRGIFEGSGDAGTVLHPGSVEFDAAQRRYIVTGSGENMWGTADAFHFVWKKVSGDATLTADVELLGTGGNAHRKAV